MREAVGLHAGVVAPVQLAVDDAADAEARAESIADKVVIALGTAHVLQFRIDLRQDAAEGLAEGVQVAVVVDEHGHAELLLEERSEGHAFAEGREVRQVTADDAVRVVGRAGEREADGDGLFTGEGVHHGLEPDDHRLQAQVQVIGIGRQRDRLAHVLFALHRAEHHVGAAGVQGKDDPGIVGVVSHIIYPL